jgi:hypothetical protein
MNFAETQAPCPLDQKVKPVVLTTESGRSSTDFRRTELASSFVAIAAASTNEHRIIRRLID